MKELEKTWRWFGEDDPISLNDIRQTGATGVVTALHHIPNGEAWSKEEILKRKIDIEEHGLTWSVVESIPVHEDIKLQRGAWKEYIENYGQSIRNLGACGISIVAYNFMPVLDWTRTDLHYQLPDGSIALRFDKVAFAAFDLFILKRPFAEKDYTIDERQASSEYYKLRTADEIECLSDSIIAGLPGAEEGYTLIELKDTLNQYENVTSDELRRNLIHFMRQISCVAAESNVRLAIHPDDPPYSVLGLPRVVSTEKDLSTIFDAVPNASNGLCFCSGSFGVRTDNDLPAIAKRFASRIHFIHLRNVTREADGSFHEADHLKGSVDMYALMDVLLEEQQQRDRPIPMRPDHGHQKLDDKGKKVNPGYSSIGRLKGLAELTGLEMGILRSAK